MQSAPLFTFLLTVLWLLSFGLATPAPAPLVPEASDLVERAPPDNSTSVDPVSTGGGSGNRGGILANTAQSVVPAAGTTSVAQRSITALTTNKPEKEYAATLIANGK